MKRHNLCDTDPAQRPHLVEVSTARRRWGMKRHNLLDPWSSEWERTYERSARPDMVGNRNDTTFSIRSPKTQRRPITNRLFGSRGYVALLPWSPFGRSARASRKTIKTDRMETRAKHTKSSLPRLCKRLESVEDDGGTNHCSQN